MIKSDLPNLEIAQELHDSIAQSLAAASLMLQTLLTQSEFPADHTRVLLQRIHTTVRTANAELRTMIDRMRKTELQTPSSSGKTQRPIMGAIMKPASRTANDSPSATASLSTASQKLVAIDRIKRIGLIESLREYFAHALLRGIKFEFTAPAYQTQDLAVEVELFRVAQEAVSNAIRHGKASVISVQLSCQQEQTRLCVINNGTPLDPARQVNSNGLGLTSMKMRMQRLAGKLWIENTAQGVMLQAVLPSRNSQEPPAPEQTTLVH